MVSSIGFEGMNVGRTWLECGPSKLPFTCRLSRLKIERKVRRMLTRDFAFASSVKERLPPRPGHPNVIMAHVGQGRWPLFMDVLI